MSESIESGFPNGIFNALEALIASRKAVLALILERTSMVEAGVRAGMYHGANLTGASVERVAARVIAGHEKGEPTE